MLKIIKNNINQKDRVICVTTSGKHELYYQSAGSKKRTFIFATVNFSGSVFDYIRNKGRNLSEKGLSLTIKELYEYKEYRNVKLTRVINRIPKMIEQAIREKPKQENCVIHHSAKQAKTVNDVYNGWKSIAELYLAIMLKLGKVWKCDKIPSDTFISC